MDEYLANSRKIKLNIETETFALTQAQRAEQLYKGEDHPECRRLRAEWVRLSHKNDALNNMRSAAMAGDAFAWKRAISAYMREEVAVLMAEAEVRA
jgi:hypothetical protein